MVLVKEQYPLAKARIWSRADFVYKPEKLLNSDER
jgi:hypothetical protein